MSKLVSPQCSQSSHLSNSQKDNQVAAEEAETPLFMAGMDVVDSHSFVSGILNSLSSHICVLDRTGVIIMVNEAWRRFAYTNSDGFCRCFEGVSYFEICDTAMDDDKETAQAFARGIRAVLDGEVEEFCLEYPCHSPDEKRWFIGRVTRMTGDTEVRVVVAHENITERKILEHRQQKMQDTITQQAKSESLTRMAEAIAFKFNSILAATLGNLERSLDYIPRGGEAAVNINLALQAAWRASELNSLMLLYLGQTMDGNEPVNLAGACHEQMSMLLRSKPAHIDIVNCLPSSGPIVLGNQKLIQQVLTILVTNAWESMNGMDVGTITVTGTVEASDTITGKHRIPLDWQAQHQRYACLEVTDTGCGIPLSSVDKLFDPFFSSKMTGRGMGLPVILGILRTHEGVITVASRLGRGSTFNVYLPLC